MLCLGCIPSFNVLPCLELVKKFVVGGGGWVCKPTLAFSLVKAEQLLKIICKKVGNQTAREGLVRTNAAVGSGRAPVGMYYI